MPAVQLTSLDAGSIGDVLNGIVNEVESLAPGSAANLTPDLANPGFTGQLEAAEIAFINGLLANESAFNAALKSGELQFETLISPLFAQFPGYAAPDSILNGVVNRSFDTFNMMVGTGENIFNGGLFGANVPPAFTGELLTTSGFVFSGGEIGGLTGVFDQGLMVFLDFAGLLNL